MNGSTEAVLRRPPRAHRGGGGEHLRTCVIDRLASSPSADGDIAAPAPNAAPYTASPRTARACAAACPTVGSNAAGRVTPDFSRRSMRSSEEVGRDLGRWRHRGDPFVHRARSCWRHCSCSSRGAPRRTSRRPVSGPRARGRGTRGSKRSRRHHEGGRARRYQSSARRWLAAAPSRSPARRAAMPSLLWDAAATVPSKYDHAPLLPAMKDRHWAASSGWSRRSASCSSNLACDVTASCIPSSSRSRKASSQ